MKISMITASGGMSRDTETYGRPPAFPETGRLTVMDTGCMFPRGVGLGLKMSPGALLHSTTADGHSFKAAGAGYPDQSR